MKTIRTIVLCCNIIPCTDTWVIPYIDLRFIKYSYLHTIQVWVSKTIVFYKPFIFCSTIFTDIKIIIYTIWVTIGFLFTLFKYAVLKNNPLSFEESLETLLIILVICGLFMFVYVLFAYLGSKKLEKDIS